MHVRVQDTTGSVSFVLFDREVNRILGLSASDIRERQLKVVSLPLLITSIFLISLWFSLIYVSVLICFFVINC